MKSIGNIGILNDSAFSNQLLSYYGEEQWIVTQLFKLLPMRHIFFDIVLRLITNRKYAFLCIFSFGLSADSIILIYWIKSDHVYL